MVKVNVRICWLTDCCLYLVIIMWCSLRDIILCETQYVTKSTIRFSENWSNYARDVTVFFWLELAIYTLNILRNPDNFGLERETECMQHCKYKSIFCRTGKSCISQVKKDLCRKCHMLSFCFSCGNSAYV